MPDGGFDATRAKGAYSTMPHSRSRLTSRGPIARRARPTAIFSVALVRTIQLLKPQIIAMSFGCSAPQNLWPQEVDTPRRELLPSSRSGEQQAEGMNEDQR
jgi:hypothetical protein